MYSEHHSHHALDPYISHTITALPSENVTPGAQEPFAASSISPGHENHSSGISVPFTSNYTPSTASFSHSWPQTVEQLPTVNPPKKKFRRERPKIALAPDQPPTTQGKPRARVYVACIQCRNRKIRCDGVKPICYNCARKSSGGSDCNYDTAPRRRGPDKTPGARQRIVSELRQGSESSGTRRRRRREATSPRDPELLSHTDIRDVATHLPNESLSPESSGSYSMPSSYTTPSTSFTSPVINVPLPGGCSCHGLIHCPNSQPYVSSKSQLLSFFDQVFQLPAPGHVESEQLSNTVNFVGAVTRRRAFSADDNSDESDDVVDISNEPSLKFSRKIWYEALCSIYASIDTRKLTYTNREAISRSISRDLRFLFRASNYWFSFFHVPTFFGQFFDTIKRENMQPSLVLAALALSVFWQSSEIEEGEKGRIRALRLREEAQSALEASFNAGFIDETLAQAAWLLALFEVCAHPAHSTSRSVSAIVMLDSIIRCLSLTVLDADDPEASVFAAGQVPRVNTHSRWSPVDQHNMSTQHSENAPTSAGCSCLSRTLGKYWPQSLEHAPMWATTAAWNPVWSEGEIRKESSRRLCWAAISLAAGHVSYASANDSHIPDLYIADPSNFALLFSGESICRALSLSSSVAKDTVWALYDRSFVLWHICARVRADTTMGDAEKGEFAVKAWLEADVIEIALNKHTCGIEKAYIFQGREYLFNTRMCISFEFQRYIPLVNSRVNGIFHRAKAKEWLSHQAIVAERFMHGLHTITGNSNNLLARRPFFVFWFMSQVLRSLRLWQCDNSLTIALDVCKAFLPAIDYLSALWPCDEQRQRYMRLRERLDSACYIANITPPPSANFTLPDTSISVL
ncbi:hypothetical protein GGU10DRAFT_269626 [Lentinula aff. detonsa]|uniref:Zn(2)-C6 fungal-type domain-containing protein n=1 Tax=Lentinula aff. detonsa TaxID=2804958 RepID=A0AA38NCW1_9AGAR|nr:hypothetical protein GGU10DRAFT_269626 [Lentinula aff. detonsa]